MLSVYNEKDGNRLSPVVVVRDGCIVRNILHHMLQISAIFKRQWSNDT